LSDIVPASDGDVFVGPASEMSIEVLLKFKKFIQIA
jgi:hypothetical protein